MRVARIEETALERAREIADASDTRRWVLDRDDERIAQAWRCAIGVVALVVLVVLAILRW